MDIILQEMDIQLLTPYVYSGDWKENSISRQFTSLMLIVTLSGYLLYFVAAGLSFAFIFDKRLMKHPQFLENQVRKEIWMTCKALPVMSFLSVLCFLLEIRGYSKLYDSIEESRLGWLSIPISMITFILFTDCLIYWIHRALHIRFFYKHLHKAHHLWKVPTPFASHAFHPVDWFLQSTPYHAYVFLVPMNKYLYLIMFVFVNFWTVSIHDGDFRVPLLLRKFVNGSAHHTDHHLYYNYNYGQFFTLWDRIGGSFRNPSAFENNSPLDQLLRSTNGVASSRVAINNHEGGYKRLLIMQSTPESVKPKKKIKNTRLFSSIFHSSKVAPEKQKILPVIGSFPILDLPRSVRVRIWKLLGFSHTKTLRLVCSLIKKDIDQFTGISSAIDSTFDDFPFHCNIAIRKVAIHELIIPRYIEFLKYPNLLQELEIIGEISLQNFHYIIKSCPNISKLLIFFNKFVLDYKTSFFPLPTEILNLKPLSKVRSIKLISTTKKLNEMAYVSRTVVSLLLETLRDANVIDSVHLSITHKTSTIYFKEVVWTTLIFVHKHASRLRYLNLTLRDKDPNAGGGVDSGGKHNEAATTENDKNNKGIGYSSIANATGTTPPQNNKTVNTTLANNSKTSDTKDRKSLNKPEGIIKTGQPESNTSNTTRRDTKALSLPPGVVITHHVKDIHSEELSTASDVTLSPDSEGEADVEQEPPQNEKRISQQETTVIIANASLYLSKTEWPKANNLEQLWLTVSLVIMDQILEIISSYTRLQVLQLETVGDGALSDSNWEMYTEFLQRSNTCMLKMVAFSAVNHVDSSTGCSIPIDLAVFRKCKSLSKLTIVSLRKNYFSKLSRAKNISKLPKTLNEISFERVLLTPWQAIRFLICFGNMRNVSISYWSISDCQFSTFMLFLKWSIMLEWTNVPNVILVDTKLRFKNKRGAVRNLQQAVAINVQYQDLDQTGLIIDTSKKQDEKAFAPIVSFHKIPDAPEKLSKQSQAGSRKRF